MTKTTTPPKKKAAARRVGLALSGGGARGAFQVGVVECLLEHPTFAPAGFSILSGTSAGAINAALLASGKSAVELRAFWAGLVEKPPVTADKPFLRELARAGVALARQEGLASIGRTVMGFLRKARELESAAASFVELLLLDRFDVVRRLLQEVHGTSVLDTSPLRDRLVDAFGSEDVPLARGVDLAIQAVDALAGRSVRYTTRRTAHTKDGYEIVDAITVDMLLASASIPVLFPAVDVGARKLWDGGVLVNTPLAPLVDLGATEIVTVLVTEAPDASRKAFGNLGDAIERLADTLLENTYGNDRKLLLERNRVGGYRAVTLYEPIRPAPAELFTVGSYLDFHGDAVAAMTRAGRDAAERWLEGGPRPDRLP